MQIIFLSKIITQSTAIFPKDNANTYQCKSDIFIHL